MMATLTPVDYNPFEQSVKLTPVDFNPFEQERAQPPEDNRSLIQRTKDLFTGNNRETEYTESMDEFDVPAKFAVTRPIATAKTALGLLTTFDPLEQVSILKENFPKLKFYEDEKGNIVVDGTEEDAGTGILNQPGISARDLLQAGFQVSLYTPAGRAGVGAASKLGAAGRVGAASGATQLVQDIAGRQLAGGEAYDVERVGDGTIATEARDRTAGDVVTDVNYGDVALAAGLGAGFEGIGQVVGPTLKSLIQKYRGNQAKITNEIRNEFRKVAIEAGRNPEEVTDELIQSYIQTGDDGLTPLEREFNVTLTRGERQSMLAATPEQKAKALETLNVEDSLRAGSLGGDKVRQAYLTEQFRRQPQIEAAAQNVQGSLGGGRLVESMDEAGRIIKTSIQDQAEGALSAVDQAYSQIGEASLRSAAAKNLFSTTRKVLTDNIDTIVDDQLTPATQAAVRKLQQYEKYLAERPESLSVGRIDNIRKVLNDLWKSAGNKTDKSQVRKVVKAYDDYVDQAVIKGMFEGDQEAIQQLKGARQLSRAYFEKFSAREGQVTRGSSSRIADRPGRFIEKIIEENPTDKEVINTLFTASSFNGKAASKMAGRFKEILGPESPEWQTVKQAAFRNMLKFKNESGESILSPQKTSESIRKAMENTELMKELFSPQERTKIMRFGSLMRGIDPNLGALKSRVTPSGKAAVNSAGEVLKSLFPAMVTGEPITLTAYGVSVLSGFGKKAKARSVFKPQTATTGVTIPLPMGREIPVSAAGAGASMSAMADKN